MNKEDLLILFKTQFGAYLQKNESSFDKSMKILENMDISEESDILYNFLHLLIINLYSRINAIESKILDK